MTKLLKISDMFNNTSTFSADQLIRAACNDGENFAGSFLSDLKRLDKTADFAKIAELCAPSCGGNWHEAVIVEVENC